MRMSHIIVCGVSGCTVIFHNITQPEKSQKKTIENKMCVLIIFTTFV